MKMKFFSRQTVLWLFLVAMIFTGTGKPVLTQTNENDETREEILGHYIVLVDATKSFRTIIGWEDQEEQQIRNFYPLIIYALEENSHNGYRAFRDQRDRVSLFFFHFPWNNGKIQGERYFYTSDDLILSRKIFERTVIEEFVRENMKSFRSKPFSPVKLARKSIVPFVNGYIREREHLQNSVRQRVDRIYLISISDEENVGIISDDHAHQLRLFSEEKDHDLFSRMVNNFETLFTGREVYQKVCYFDRNRGAVMTKQGNQHKRPFYIKCSEIKPKIEVNMVVRSREIKLERVVRMEESKQVIYWKGDMGVYLNLDGSQASGWIEYARVHGENPNGLERWRPAREMASGGNNIKFLKTSDGKSLIYIKKNESTANIDEDLRKFKEVISFRGARDVEPSVEDYAYPFKYRYYTEPAPVTYIAADLHAPAYYEYRDGEINSEKKVTDSILKAKLQEKPFREALIAYLEKNPQADLIHQDIAALQKNGIKELSPGMTAEVSEFIARRTQEHNIAKRNIIIIGVISGILAIFLVSGYLLYFRRNPSIKVRFKKEPGVIGELDFSREKQGKHPIASIELQNTVTPLSKKREKKPFKLKLNMSYDYKVEPGETEDTGKVKNDSQQIITLLKNIPDSEEIFVTESSDGLLEFNIPDMRVGDSLKVILDFDEIKDLEINQNDMETVRDQKVTISLRLNHASAAFNEENKPVVVVDEKEDWEQDYPIDFIPEKPNKDKCISLHPTDIEKTAPLTCDGNEKFCEIPYSARHHVRKFFEIKINNTCKHLFSKPLTGDFSLQVIENGAPLSLKKEPAFWLKDEDKPGEDDNIPLEEETVTVSLIKGECRTIGGYVSFPRLGKNPRQKRDFQVYIHFEKKNIQGSPFNLSIPRSNERTEALVWLGDEGEPAVLENVENLTQDIELIIEYQNKKARSKNKPINVEAKISHEAPKPIMGYSPTELFTLRLKNNCNTGTGYFDWQISNITLKSNEDVDVAEEERHQVITIKPQRNNGRIEDDTSVIEEIVFLLNPDKITLRKFNLSLQVSFTLIIILYPGPSLGSRKKVINYMVTIEGYHDVEPNRLVIDFGTSAIAVANSEYSLGPDEEKNTNPIGLEAPKDRMESRDGLLPSIININKDKVIESKEFISLPAERDILSTRPDYLVSSLKLKIVAGENDFIPPKDFKYKIFKDQKEKSELGKPIQLKSMLKSTYKNLKNQYIDLNVTDYKKLVITCPNLYNKTHKRFLKKLLSEIFANYGEGRYEENIELISESDAVLYYYLKQKVKGKIQAGTERIIIFDIGGGTLDITLAAVRWEKNASYPAKVEVIKRDGIQFAGEVLDKAIALQVHNILKRYNTVPGKAHGRTNISNMAIGEEKKSITYAREFEEKFEEDKKPELQQDDSKINLQNGNISDEYSTNFDEEKKDNIYVNAIAGEPWKERVSGETNHPIKSEGSDRKNIHTRLMFDFKYKYILEFKEQMGQKDMNDLVKICLGQDIKDKGICILPKGEMIAKDFVIDGITYHSYIQRDHINSLNYLYLKKVDWLELPYIKRFKELFREKVDIFIESMEEKPSQDMTLILSGRTSLWPDIPVVIQEAFSHQDVDIWSEDFQRRAGELKRAVIEGAIQKVVCWHQIEYEEPTITGAPAVKYQEKPGMWEVKTLSVNAPVEIDLNNSPYFQIGLKTALDFVPFMNCSYLVREHYCTKDYKMKMHIRERKIKNEVDYDFFVQSAKYDKEFKKIIHDSTSDGPIKLRGTNWPIEESRLPEVEPDKFDEQI